jgi:hypothetical protein
MAMIGGRPVLPRPGIVHEETLAAPLGDGEPFRVPVVFHRTSQQPQLNAS